MKDVESDIKRLAKQAVGEGWGDRLIREACTVTGENFQHFLPLKYSRLKTAIRDLKQQLQTEIVS